MKAPDENDRLMAGTLPLDPEADTYLVSSPTDLAGWRDALVTKTDKHGTVTVRPVLANAIAILAHDPAWVGVLAWDAFREAVVTTKPPPWDAVDAPASAEVGEWSDADTSRACAWLARHYDIEIKPAAVDNAVVVVAERTVVHPVVDWLLTLEWDGSPRIDRLFVDYFGADDTAYARGVGARFMIGAVARVREPGAKVDCTPILEGAQGTGKSTGIRRLAGDALFFDTPIVMGEKDGYQALRGKWIGELGELHALSRSDLNRAKNFLTATVDHYRPSFGRRARDFKRQCVFIATTNAGEYLRDETGNRRFWPVRCRKVDCDAIARDRPQLWAEAFARYANCERWHVDSAEFAELCAVEQDDRFVADAWQEPIQSWISSAGHPERRRDGVTTGDVLEGALAIVKERWTKGDQDRVAAVLRRLGWARGKQARGADGKHERRYRPTAAQLVTAGDEPVTEPVTAETSRQYLVSPVSPADARIHGREKGDRSAYGSGIGGDGGYAVTTGGAE